MGGVVELCERSMRGGLVSGGVDGAEGFFDDVGVAHLVVGVAGSEPGVQLGVGARNPVVGW